MAHRNLKELEQQLGIFFKQRHLLNQAFTHSSYVNERRLNKHQDNERLEFLGDAVLELTVSEYLYKKFPDYTEGELTKLRAATVCEPALVEFAERLNFGQYVLLGKGEEMTGGRTRPALLADVFESFVAALYLDKGMQEVDVFLRKHVLPSIPLSGGMQVNDYKTSLQEYIQQNGLGQIEYRIVDERGPAHDREFAAEVYMNNKTLGVGTGKTKKEAEQRAAEQALSAFDPNATG